jgi:hypothetical protein
MKYGTERSLGEPQQKRDRVRERSSCNKFNKRVGEIQGKHGIRQVMGQNDINEQLTKFHEHKSDHGVRLGAY